VGKTSRILFIAMASAFGLCILGLVGGMTCNLFLVITHRGTLESVLGKSIPFYKSLGALGILGFLLFLAFLIVSIATNSMSDKKPPLK
jgi:hypothetical protein